MTAGVNTPETEQHWTDLMERSLQGDTVAYRELLVLLTVALRGAVRSRLSATGMDPEDVVQEVLMALHLKRATWVAGTPVGPWVTAIARNKIVDAFRRRGRRLEVPIDSVLETLPTDTTHRDEQAHDLQRALERLNERQREVVRGMSIEGCSAQEVGARLRMSEGAVRVALHRSLKLLAAALRAVG